MVFENGRAGINGEHTWADAIVVVRLFDNCIKYVNERFKTEFQSSKLIEAKAASTKKPHRLVFEIDHVALTYIECASAAISKLIHAVDIKTLQFNHYGNDFLKRYKLTPDFYIQMAIQLTYYKMYHTIPGKMLGRFYI